MREALLNKRVNTFVSAPLLPPGPRICSHTWTAPSSYGNLCSRIIYVLSSHFPGMGKPCSSGDPITPTELNSCLDSVFPSSPAVYELWGQRRLGVPLNKFKCSKKPTDSTAQ